MAASSRVGTSRIPPSPVGELLQHWRRQRRMSQLALSAEAGVTPRHVSFVESGRASPSRGMVLRLARALDVPLRERNQMLTAAGYAPLYRETGLDAEAMSRVRGALETLLAHHEPHPAVVMDRHWNIVLSNDAAAAMFDWLLDGADPGEPPNVVRLMFTRLRPHVANWEQTHRDVEWEGETYTWSKSVEFLKLLDVPGRAGVTFSPAFVLDDPETLATLERVGWQVIAASSISRDLDRYRGFVRGSTWKVTPMP